jgi:hypothetical protein
MDIEKVEIPLKDISLQLRPEFIGLLAVVLLRNRDQGMQVEYMQENRKIWEAVKKMLDILVPYVNYRM